MPSCTYGSEVEGVFRKLQEKTKLDINEVYACVYYIYSGDYQCTSDRMRVGLQTFNGWSISTLQEKIPVWLRQGYEALQRINWFRPECIDHPANSLGAYSGAIGSLDTVPIYVQAGNSAFYQAKYAAKVVKLLFVVSNTGFIVAKSSVAFTGPCHDSSILDRTGIMGIIGDRQVLADGVFRRTASVLGPFTKPQIWPVRLAPRQTIAEYDAAANERLQHNERHAHFRARVEHLFAAPNFGRFKLLHACKVSSDIMYFAVEWITAILNYEVLIRHGWCGKYLPVSDYTDEQHHVLAVKFSEAKNMRSRYPVRTPMQHDNDDLAVRVPLDAAAPPPAAVAHQDRRGRRRGREEADPEQRVLDNWLQPRPRPPQV